VELNGKVAIVTGSGVRLGRAIAMGLAQSGAQLVLHYGRSAEAARDTLSAVQSAGATACLIEADLHDPCEAATRIVDAAMTEFGRVDLLVNNASIFEADSLADATQDQWERHFAINLQAPFFLSQAVASRLGSHARGHIVNIADWRGQRPGGDHLIYTLTKAGLLAMTKSLAQHLAPRIQVNAIAPGAILPAADADPAEFAALAADIPLRRTGTCDDVVDALLFLLRSDFVTGEVVHVTGGQQL